MTAEIPVRVADIGLDTVPEIALAEVPYRTSVLDRTTARQHERSRALSSS
jgi:hypothetical protein